MKKKIGAPSQSSPTHGHKEEEKEMFGQVHQTEQINTQNEADQLKAGLNVERVTKTQLTLFLIYTVSLLVIVNVRVDFPLQYGVNEVNLHFFLNEIQEKNFQPVNSSKPTFSSVQDTSTLIRYIRNTIIYSMFQDDGGNVVDPVYPNIAQFQLISPVRIKQRRAMLLQQPENRNFPTKWEVDESSSNSTPYGNMSSPFFYTERNDGFCIFLQPMYTGYNETLSTFNKAVQNGYFDSQTMEVSIDFGRYGVVTDLIIYFKLIFTFSPTGRITSSYKTVSLPLTFYDGALGVLMLVFQIIFVLLFLHYFIQEFVKVYTQIKKAAPPETDEVEEDDPVKKALAEAQKLKAKVISILQGLLNHIKDPWSFLDTVSLICAFIKILTWCTLLYQDRFQSTLARLENTSGLSTDEKMIITTEFSQQMEDTVELCSLFRQMAAINLLILLIKTLKFITALNDKVMEQVQVAVGVASKIVPFVILFLTILISYVFMSYFMFGNTMQEFSSYFSAFRYFLTNVHNSYTQMTAMVNKDATITLIFHILFIFVVIFILVNMFAIYVIHAYQDYMAELKVRQKKREKIKGQYAFQPHPLWIAKNFLEEELNLIIYRIFNKKRYFDQTSYLQEKAAKDEKELLHYPDFHFDMSIDDTFKEAKKLNPIFNTDAAIRKVKKDQKVKTVKHIWATAGVWAVFIILIVVTDEHHKPARAQNLTSSVETLLQQQNIKVLSDDGYIRTYQYPRTLDNLLALNDILGWLRQLFTHFTKPANVTLKENDEYRGSFIAGENFLVTDRIRFTLRKRSEIPVNTAYHGINTLTYTPLFDPEDKNPSGEMTSTLIGVTRNYNFTEDDGYRSAGGYVMTWPVTAPDYNYTHGLQDLAIDGIIDQSINSLVVDFPLYHILAKEALSVIITFSMTPGSFISTETSINMISMDYYNTAKQFFVAVIEVIAIVWAVTTTYKVYRALKSSNYHYNYWYSLYIANFPEVVKGQRARKKPEFARKLEYMFEFNTIINLCMIAFFFIAAALWLYYLVNIMIVKKTIKDFAQTTAANARAPVLDQLNGDLMAKLHEDFYILYGLKITESIILLLLSVKLLYFYSYFAKFKFLTETIRNSFERLPHMFVVVLFIIISFGFFVQTMKGTIHKSYSDIVSMMAEQLQNLNQLEEKSLSLIKESDEVFMTFVYYFPWVIFAALIISNMFLGIIISAYQAVDEHDAGEEDDEKFDLKEFIVMSLELFRTRNKFVQNQRVHFEVNEQSMNSFNFERVFDDFGNLVDLAANYRNVNLWATACTQNILAERDCRKTMKKISKEITKASVIDFDFEKHEHKTILTKNEKLSQFALKLKYWNYFKCGHEKLLHYMKTFNKVIQANDKILGDARNRRIQQKVDDKIKKYILHLESEVSQNINDVQQMRKRLEEYQREKKEL